MAAWAVSALRDAHPNSHIVWGVEPGCSPVIDREKLVQRISLFHRSRWKSSRWTARTWKEQILAYGRLRNQRFDLGFDFHGHSKTALALRLANPKQRIATFATDSFSRFLNPVATGNSGIHIIEQHLNAINQLAQGSNTYNCPIKPFMPITSKAVQRNSSSEVVSIMTGVSSVAKSLNPLALAELAEKLIKAGHNVSFVGGPKDPIIEVQGAQNFVGTLSLGHTMDVISSSSLHISADTGTGHIASAYGIPTVTVFGKNGHNPEIYRPYGPLAHVVCSHDSPDMASGHELFQYLEDNIFS